MPAVKGALILLPACSCPPPFEDCAQYQLLTQACKHISTLISPQTYPAISKDDCVGIHAHLHGLACKLGAAGVDA